MFLLITISTFICVSFGVMALYMLVFRNQSAAAERLHSLPSVNGVGAMNVVQENPMVEFAERVATPLNRLMPPSAAKAGKLQKQLMYAGYRAPNAPVIYRGIQLLTITVLPALVVLICFIYARPLNSSFGWLMFAFFAGYFLPRFALDRMISKRQRLIQWGLADTLDLMVVSMEAGLGLNAALIRISKELKEVHPDICKELEIANLEIQMGREREEALRNLAERTGVEDLRSLTAMLIQADRFGTSIAKAVRVYSDSMRTKRRQRAEQAAQKAAVKLLLPLACFLFPTLFIAILGPAYLQLVDTFANM